MSHERTRPVRPHITTIVIDTRARLNITQVELASLLGVHPLTVSKWERGVREPNAYQLALVKAFRTATYRYPEVGAMALHHLRSVGVVRTLQFLFSEAFR
jgi:putative transcriptional regulator